MQSDSNQPPDFRSVALDQDSQNKMEEENKQSEIGGGLEFGRNHQNLTVTEADDGLGGREMFQSNAVNAKSKGYDQFDYVDSSDSKSEAGASASQDTHAAGDNSEVGHGRKGLKKF